MPRRKEWPPRPHAHKASGQDRVRVNGRDVYLGPTGSEESRRNYAELVARLAQELPVEQPAKDRAGLRVARLVELHDIDAQKRYDPAGREALQYRWAAGPLLSRHGQTPVAAFGVRELGEVRDAMVGLGWSRGVINRRMIRIRTLWRWAEQHGHAPAGSWNALRSLAAIPRHDRRVKSLPPRQPCDWKTLALVCRFCPATVRGMLIFGWFTGARPGEIRSLKVSDVDCSGEVWLCVLGKHKNTHRGQARVVAVGPRCQGILRRFLEGKKPGEPVFPSAPQQCYTCESFSRAVARARARCGVADFHPYQSRHAYKRRVTREMGIDAARSALGQASLSSTDRYAASQDVILAVEAARRCG